MAAEERNVMQQIVDGLSGVYNAEGVAIWLDAIQDWPVPGIELKHNALHMVRIGRHDVVLQRIEQLATGAVL